MAGTRTPRPRGPAIPSVSDFGTITGDGLEVRYSPGVPAGAVGGGTWSNQPSFSSYIKNSAVFAQTAGLAVRASRTSEVKYMPLSGDEEGWSSNPRGGMIPRDTRQRPGPDITHEIVRKSWQEGFLIERRCHVPEGGEVRQDVVAGNHHLGIEDRVVQGRVPGRVGQEAAVFGRHAGIEGVVRLPGEPASCRTSCIVDHVQFHNASGVKLVSVMGPPAVPAGSMVPLLAISRLGWVGPRIEA